MGNGWIWLVVLAAPAASASGPPSPGAIAVQPTTPPEAHPREVAPPVTAPPSGTAPSAPPPTLPPTQTRPQVTAQPGRTGMPGPGVPAWPREREPDWSRPLDDGERELLRTYRGFSADGTRYAWAEPPEPGAAPVLVVMRVEGAPGHPGAAQRVTLDSPQVAAGAVLLLADGGFPRPGSQPLVPEAVQARVDGDAVTVTLNGVAQTRWRPFADRPDVQLLRAEPTTFAAAGRLVAVRVTARGPDGEVLPPVHQVVALPAATAPRPPGRPAR